jgi:hypothetical protein
MPSAIQQLVHGYFTEDAAGMQTRANGHQRKASGKRPRSWWIAWTVNGPHRALDCCTVVWLRSKHKVRRRGGDITLEMGCYCLLSRR